MNRRLSGVPATHCVQDAHVRSQPPDRNVNNGVARWAQASLPPTIGRGPAAVRARLLVSLAREVPQMVIVGGSDRWRSCGGRVTALEQYEGYCFEQLRQRVGSSLPHRLRLFVLSTPQGLIGANERLRPCDPARFPPSGLKNRIRKVLHPYLELFPVEEVLLVMAPHYLDVLPRVTGRVGEVHTIVDPVRGWPQVDALLDRWGWPRPSVPGM